MKEAGFKILYISDIFVSHSLFFSQVLLVIKEYTKYMETRAIFLTKFWKDFERLKLPISYLKIRGLPKKFIKFVRYVDFIINFFKLKSFFYDFIPDIIFCRDTISGWYAVMINKYILNNKSRVVLDIRGDMLSEFLGYKELNTRINKLFTKSLMSMQKNIINNADLLFFVSSRLAKKYKEIYKFNKKFFVFPTVVPEKYFYFDYKIRNSKRRELNFREEDVVYVYSGSDAFWQNVDFIIESFKKSLSYNNNIKLLILSKNKKTFLKKLQSVPRSHYRVISLASEKVAEYLQAADYALMIRDNNDINKCASPTKFGEYINCGLKVVLNKVDSDYFDLAIKQLRDEVILLKDKDELDNIFYSLGKDNRINICRKINILSQIVQQHISIFRDLLFTYKH